MAYHFFFCLPALRLQRRKSPSPECLKPASFRGTDQRAGRVVAAASACPNTTKSIRHNKTPFFTSLETDTTRSLIRTEHHWVKRKASSTFRVCAETRAWARSFHLEPKPWASVKDLWIGLWHESYRKPSAGPRSIVAKSHGSRLRDTPLQF